LIDLQGGTLETAGQRAMTGFGTLRLSSLKGLHYVFAKKAVDGIAFYAKRKHLLFDYEN